MHTRHHMPLRVAVPLLVSLLLGSLAGHASAGQPSSGPDPATHAAAQGQPRPLVSLRLHALAPEKVTLSDPAHGVVRATVLALDAESHQITVQTDTALQEGTCDKRQ